MSFLFFFSSPFSFRFLNRFFQEKKERKHVLILFAWGRCWNLSLEAHLFVSNPGSEPGLPQTALLLRKPPWVYFCCCCCFGFIVCWFVGFNSTWTDHLVSDVGFRRLIPSPDLGKAFNKVTRASSADSQNSEFPEGLETDNEYESFCNKRTTGHSFLSICNCVPPCLQKLWQYLL